VCQKRVFVKANSSGIIRRHGQGVEEECKLRAVKMPPSNKSSRRGGETASGWGFRGI